MICQESDGGGTMTSLSAAEVDTRVRQHTGWEHHGDEITKQFSFGDFKQAMTFVNKVADAANAADHHPDITINYNRVTMTLSTHSEGGITEKDFALATKIDAAAG
jgi:4a-hydroxytetrahydrobiopterin dehydratase